MNNLLKRKTLQSGETKNKWDCRAETKFGIMRSHLKGFLAFKN